MKRIIVIMAVAGASMVAIGQPPPKSTPAPSSAPMSMTVSSQPVPKKESAQIQKPLISTPLSSKPIITPKVWSVDGASSRPWTQIVGIRPGYSSFPRTEMHEPRMYFFWIGRDPRQPSQEP